MENCCARTSDAAENQQDQPNKARRRKKRKHNKKERKPNPFADDLSLCGRSPNFRVLKDIMVGRSCIMDKYVLGRELGRGEFGITYLCMDRESKESLACKSISKKMLHTAIDVEDVRHEVTVLSNLLDHTNIVKLKATYEDAHGVHLVMELCEGGELFDRIVARGHYTKRTTAAVVCTVVEVVQMCHGHGVIHRDLKPDNFMFSFFFPLK